MPGYLLIESRDPFDSKGFSQRCELALILKSEDAEVSVFLLENAVLGARATAKLAGLDKLAKAGVRLFADEFALRERGVTELAPNIHAAGLETLIGELAAGAKALWN
ncbi:MAG TPA: DsrE family protein [Steroidobacteraceae bacterium]|jgi:sulfur relay (sulfurtransferase) complex TusBCD TusD component (DsrE family)